MYYTKIYGCHYKDHDLKNFHLCWCFVPNFKIRFCTLSYSILYFSCYLQRKSSLMPLLQSWWNQTRASLNWRKNIKKSLRPWEKGNKKKGPWFKRINVLQLKNWSNPKEGMELLFVEKGIFAKKEKKRTTDSKIIFF